MGWNNLKNRDLKWKFQAEIYILVGMGWGERQITDSKIGRAFGNLDFDRPGDFWSSFSNNFANRGRENVDLGEIYIFQNTVL